MNEEDKALLWAMGKESVLKFVRLHPEERGEAGLILISMHKELFKEKHQQGDKK